MLAGEGSDAGRLNMDVVFKRISKIDTPTAGAPNAMTKTALQHRACQPRPARIDPQNVLYSDASDFTQRLVSQKRLMRRNEHVRKAQEPREQIIRKRLVGQVFEEDTFLLLVNIECDAAEFSCLERRNQRGSVHE